MTTKRSRAPLLATVIFWSALFQVHANTVYLSDSSAWLPNSTWTDFGSTLYAYGAGTDSAVAGVFSPSSGSDYRYTTASNVNGQQFSYSLTNVVGQGVSMSLTPLGGSSSFSFQTIQIPASVAGYNALDIRAYADGGKAVDWQNISFSIATSDQVLGAITPGSLTSVAGDTIYKSIAYFQNDGSKADLSQVNWTFSADVTLVESPSSGGFASFTASSVSSDPPPPSGVASVPETSTWVMGLLALGAVGVLIRQKRQTA